MEIEQLYLSQEKIREIKSEILFERIGNAMMCFAFIALAGVVIIQILR